MTNFLAMYMSLLCTQDCYNYFLFHTKIQWNDIALIFILLSPWVLLTLFESTSTWLIFPRTKLNHFFILYLDVFVKTLSIFSSLQLTKNHSLSSFSHACLTKREKLYSSMVLLVQCHVGFAAEIELPIIVDDRAYVPKPPLDTEHTKIWYHSSFTPTYLLVKCTRSRAPFQSILRNPNF